MDMLRSPEDVLEYLKPLIPAVYKALTHGVSLAESEINSMGHGDDPWLRSHIVRYAADAYLREQDTQGEWEPGPKLPMSGLEVRRGPLVVKILKARDDGPPPSGNSIKRTMFYTQMTLAYDLDEVGVSPPGIGGNFILDWSADQSGSLTLHLSRPNGWWRYFEEPKLDWRRQIILPDEGGPRFVPGGERAIPIRSVLELNEAGDEL